MMKQKKTTAKQTSKRHLPVQLSRAHGWFKKRNRWQRYSMYLLLVAILLFTSSIIVDRIMPQVKDPNYGVSFSKDYSKGLGLDWKANFTALLDDMKIRNFRLVSYWEDVEPTNGTYDFTDLDWQMQQVAARGGHVSLAIGLRQPRWPECHEPEWAGSLSYQQWRQSLNAFISAVVDRYKDNPALGSYQLENEAVNDWFGGCGSNFYTVDLHQRLQDEFNLVKQHDPHHKIIMSLSDQHGLPFGKPKPDVFGFSEYRIVWNDKGPWHFYVTYPTPVWFHRVRAWLLITFWHRPVIIHELQMEPWGPVGTKEMTIDEQNKSMNPQQVVTNFTYARRTGIKETYLWGGEWWYWRKVHFQDPSIWNAVKGQIDGRSH